MVEGRQSARGPAINTDAVGAATLGHDA